MINFTKLTEERFVEILRAAVDWQYLICKSGGMARKSDCEEWLAHRYGIDLYTGHQIMNMITEGPRYFCCGSDATEWSEWNAHRPAPNPEDYPDIDYTVGRF